LLLHSASRPPVPPRLEAMLFPRGCSRNIRNSSPFPGHAGRFVEYKCNIECCCYGWSFNNKVKGMTEDAARQASDGNYEHFRHLHDNPTYIQPRDWPVDSRRIGWNGNGTGTAAGLLASVPGISRTEDGELRFSDWKCRAGQGNVIVRTDGTVGTCFPMCSATYYWVISTAVSLTTVSYKR